VEELAPIARDFYKEKHPFESASLSMDLNIIKQPAGPLRATPGWSTSRDVVVALIDTRWSCLAV